MEQAELEQIIEKARLDRSTTLSFLNYQPTILPDSLCSLSDLVWLSINYGRLTELPGNIGNLTNCTNLNLTGNNLSTFPEEITSLYNLENLCLSANPIENLSENIGNLSSLNTLHLDSIQLSRLPNSIGNLLNLTWLTLNNNQISVLPESIARLTNLTRIHLNDNPLTDLSILQDLPVLEEVLFLNIYLPCRYWSKFSDWKSEWLLDEDNAEIRRILIEQVGYEKICKELNAVKLDIWQEYTLLKIDGIEAVYDEDDENENEPIDREPMLLLKMTCPSTQHIHILRVPPEMTSAEAAITWINHGIHPDKFSVQT